MKTKRIFRNALSTASFAGITLATLLSAVSCDNKDYNNASPFDNVVYIDAAELQDVSNFTFTRKKELSTKMQTERKKSRLYSHFLQMQISMLISKQSRHSLTFTTPASEPSLQYLTPGITNFRQNKSLSQRVKSPRNLSPLISHLSPTWKLTQAICYLSPSTKLQME